MTCKKVLKPKLYKRSCLRYKLTDVRLFREGSLATGFEYSHRWPILKMENITARPSAEVKTICVTQDYGNESGMKFKVRKFIPMDGDPEHLDGVLDAIYRPLNPPSHLGNVQGTADERSLVYVTGGCGKPQAIVFVNLDPAISNYCSRRPQHELSPYLQRVTRHNNPQISLRVRHLTSLPSMAQLC